ncbi:Rne/Rng family ribonuclease [Salinibacterium sp. G-O1]|uniref:ribonuclease E/G n=1 Tax=Salinibacterium sp. G-O1 TaxID=3046208 RepID=UPI0024B96BFA|nr:ribonuclease E/G [Salinibacterium sp. G-O1]MDJ0335495.1 Rne/Rng family ribonuclease [Salinibacterium sp. G-O1]
MVNTHDNNADGPKKRSRLFGGRKAARDAAAAVPTPDETPAAPAAQSQAPRVVAEPKADAAPAEKPQVTQQDAAEKPASDQPPVKRNPPRKAAQAPAAADADAPVATTAPAKKAPARPSTSLLFQAPDLPPMPERAPGRESNARADREPREKNARDQGRENSRDGGNTRGDQNNQDNPDEAGTVRRRSRRRPGEEARPGDEAPNTVVRVRQPRPEPVVSNEPTRIKGSTRLEAKKQRRRDGRDAGRRRPVVTESEFLARRESVDRMMVVRSKFDRIQIAVLEDNVLVEHYVAKAADASLIGNVYLGRVQNVLPSMEAAFVDIGRGRNAVLYSGEVDWDAAALESGEGKTQARRIELALKPGDRVLVQVTKDPVGHKGARLTSQVSLPGRYLVYVPNGSMSGISRKLPDTERARLKKILKEVLPENVGVIVRTAAEGATEEQLTLDVQRLTSQWAEISRQVETQQAPALLHSEPDLLIKIVRDVFNEDFQKLVVDGLDAKGTIEGYLNAVAPDLSERVESYDDTNVDSFDKFRITEQIEKALDRKVWLPSGGSLVIDRTEAMTVVDVNTGKFVGSGGNLEETVTKNNIEAAEEIVRQLRLRDIGGIIVVDFIDMVLESNRDLVLRRLVECLSRDRTKHQVAEVTSLGLVQMTRKKLGLGLLETFSEPCEVCSGRGVVVHHDPVTKNRQQQQTAQPAADGNSRRGRNRNSGGGNGGGNNNNGGNGGGNGGGQSSPSTSVKNGMGSAGTHAITEDVRNALARVAASTVTHTTEIPVQQAAPAQPEAAEAPSKVEEVSVAAAEAAVAILDIPVKKNSRAPRKISTHDAEQILDSVLDALPAPKQPGQGRSRVSRRVSSPIITTDDNKA